MPRWPRGACEGALPPSAVLFRAPDAIASVEQRCAHPLRGEAPCNEALPTKIEGESGWRAREEGEMTGGRPFKIQIFVAEGRPDGLRLVEKSNWIGQSIVCPRGRYSQAKKREEFSRSGVYLLVGQDGDTLPKLYVGEAEEVKTRLDLHYANKDFWQQAIVFTTKGTPLNKAQVKYLEARLLELAKKYGRTKLQNSAKPRLPGLSEADQAEMEGYLDELLSLLPVLGGTVFRTRRTALEGSQGLPCEGTELPSDRV